MTSRARALGELRAHAIGHSLFAPVGLAAAIGRMGFVQADPIRAPARAQDLILRHRVRGYAASELERRFATLDLEEGYLYAYGFVAPRLSRFLHPRGGARLSGLEREVLAAVRELGVVHPRGLEGRFGGRRVTNAWGGWSKATTRALDHLHHRGLLQVARRERGVRLYRAAPALAEQVPPQDRLRGLLLAVADVLAPVSRRTLLAIGARLARTIPRAPAPREVLRALLASDELAGRAVDGVDYLWPAAATPGVAPAPRVSLLAPFDPVVWDRRRFEHLFGWAYRFEAYTPPARRVRGYYALPVLWGDQAIGWANARVHAGALRVDLGQVGPPARPRDFRRELAAEVERLATFLGVTAGRPTFG